eukprot:scaffold10114_cov67-Phaeocystis_antarctica.AAC.2
MTRDREGTLVRFSPSRRSRGSWLNLARIVPQASGAVALSRDGRSSAPDRTVTPGPRQLRPSRKCGSLLASIASLHRHAGCDGRRG